MEVRRIKTDELYHHGVKGQRWGVRRYQNPDGTLTPRGQKKLEKYRTREIGYVNKRIAVSQKRVDKINKKLQTELNAKDEYGESETDNKRVEKLSKKLNEEKTRHAGVKAIADKEIAVLKDYKLSDFRREGHDMNVRAGETAAKAAVMTMAAVPLAATTGVMVYTIPSIDIRSEKTQYRLGQNKMSDKAYRQYQNAQNNKSNAKKYKKYTEKMKKQIEKDKYKYG